MLTYIIALGLNIPFRLMTGKTKNLTIEAYYRIPFEDWAYWGGSTSGSHIDSTLVASRLSTGAHLYHGAEPLWLLGIGVLLIYSLIRAFAPSGH